MSEQRQRYLRNLIKEAILNVLQEQEPPVPTSAVPPATPGIAPETNAVEAMEPAVPAEQVFTVELMVDKLNILRGGQSFDDPEVFGRLTGFFNTLTDEQKASLEHMLSELGKSVIGAAEEEAGLEDNAQQQAQQGGAAQPAPPAPATPSAQSQITSPVSPTI